MSSDGDFSTACRLWSSLLDTLFNLQLSVPSLVLSWMRSPMLSKRQASEENNSVSGNQWIIQPGPALVPEPLEPPAVPVSHGPSTHGPSTRGPTQRSSYLLNKGMTEQEEEKRAEPIRIRAKGLLERRGSSASLTIELLPAAAAAAAAQVAAQDASAMVTPTRECTAEEYLASAGNVLSRGQLRQVLSDTRALHREFWDLPLNHPEKTMVVGCGPKNRYRSILPNERSRVCLPAAAATAAEAAADKLDQYINANYIRGYDGEERAYIATQGPLAHTLADFWSLVWSERVPAIVMVTRLVEQGRVKCESYLPETIGETHSYADISVTVLSIECKGGHFLRNVRLERDGTVRHVLHFWYEAWPDHKTPPGLAAACDLVSLAQEVEAVRRGRRATVSAPAPTPATASASMTAFPWDGDDAAAVGRLLAEMSVHEEHSSNPRSEADEDAGCAECRSGPVLVHCSAGIGRTGCFVAVSIGISQLRHEGNVDVLGIVCQMRIDRGGMIQTAEQYEFVHRALCLFEETLPPPGESS